MENFRVGAQRDAVIDGNVERGILNGGPIGRLADEIKSIKKIIDEMIDDAESELQRLYGIFNEK